MGREMPSFSSSSAKWNASSPGGPLPLRAEIGTGRKKRAEKGGGKRDIVHSARHDLRCPLFTPPTSLTGRYAQVAGDDLRQSATLAALPPVSLLTPVSQV